MSERYNDKNDNRPLLIFIFSLNCGGCTVFKRTVFPHLEKELPHDKIKVNILEFPTMEIPTTGKINIGPGKIVRYHPQLKNHIKQFPSFILVDQKSWDNNNSQISPIICDTENYNKNGILNWVNKSLSLFNSPSTISFRPSSSSTGSSSTASSTASSSSSSSSSKPSNYKIKFISSPYDSE